MASLSVIIPTYNRQAETVRAVASACANAPADAEIIVIDDASVTPFNDNSADGRVKVIRLDKNQGAAAARNVGLRTARGEWAAFLDSDDIWPDNSLAKRWTWARENNKNQDLTIFVAGFDSIDARQNLRRRYPVSSRDPRWFASGCWFCPGSTALFPREPIVGAIGLQDENLRRLEDVDWFLRLALAGGGVAAAPFIGAEITQGARAKSQTIRTARTALLHKHEHLPSALRRRLSAYLDLETAAAALGERRFGQTALYLAQSWLKMPRARLHLEPFWNTRA